MKKIKALLIIFPILIGLSIGSTLYIKNLDNKVFIPVPSCDKSCPIFQDCSNKNDLSPAKQLQCELCQECRERRTPLLEIAQAEHTKYENYSNFLFIATIASVGLTLLTAIAYLAVKFSVVRTMAAVSLIWFLISIVFLNEISYKERMLYLLLVNSPIFIFWLYRFIRLGPSKMFKDN